MKKTVINGIMFTAVVGMLLVIGSLATFSPKENQGIVPNIEKENIAWTSGSNVSLFASSYTPTGATSVLLYTVPAGKRFKINDVILSNTDSFDVKSVCLTRNATTLTSFMCVPLRNYTIYDHTFTNLYLNAGEKLYLYVPTGSTAIRATITGLLTV